MWVGDGNPSNCPLKHNLSQVVSESPKRTRIAKKLQATDEIAKSSNEQKKPKLQADLTHHSLFITSEYNIVQE